MRNKEFVLPVIIGTTVAFLVSTIAMIINIIWGVLCVVLSVALLTVFVVYTKKRYDKINDLNTYLSRVVAGDFDMNINENTEGELSILENNLFKVITMLKASNEAVTNDKVYLADSLADISHQLKTPLTSMMVITDLLKYEQNEDKKNEFVDIIENQCEKMKWLIATLLKLSKIDAGTAEFNNAELSIEDVVEKSAEPFALTLDLRNIELVKSIKPFEYNGDKNWSIEAIQNIIKNCIEHTDDNGKLRITTDVTPLYNQLVIEDNGCGIAKEDLPHIFERFYHGKNASSDSVGIGLALSKEILRKQNAIINVESQEGIGTKFEIKFYKSVVWQFCNIKVT